jgi:BirA family biotin operon repressor/biotin-[acetyl-CoA-carboxylase] ligase
VTARALAEAIDELAGVRAELKHPNDVLLAGKKVAGVLAETVDGRVTLGVGVNVNQSAAQLPAAARLPPTSLRLETGHAHDRATLLAELLYRLERRYDAWLETVG